MRDLLGSVKGANGQTTDINVGIATATPSNIFTIGQNAGKAIADGWNCCSVSAPPLAVRSL
jgi:hypothetical protein